MIKLLRYNVLVCGTMSMFKLNKKFGLIIKILFYSWRLICNLGLISAIILSLMEIYYKKDKEIDKIAVEVMNSVIFLSSVIRINYFYFREDKLEKLVKMMNESFKRRTNTGFEEKTIDFYDRLNKNVVLIWSFAVFFTGQFMALLPIFFIGKTGRILPLPLWYPYDWKSSPNYELTYFTQSLIQYFMGFSYGASDMFFVCVGIMIGGQFELLSFELENVVFTALLKQDVSKRDVIQFKNDLFGERINVGMLRIIETEKFRSDLKEILKVWVQNHQVLVKICEESESFFAPLLLPNVMLSISYNIFIMYSIVISKSFNSTTYSLIEYILISHTQLFCLTFIGQKLTTSSEMVLESLWKSPWYLCDKKIQKIFLIIQMNLKKPILLTAWKFFPMGLSTFLFAIKTSFSYLTFLRQVTE